VGDQKHCKQGVPTRIDGAQQFAQRLTHKGTLEGQCMLLVSPQLREVF